MKLVYRHMLLTFALLAVVRSYGQCDAITPSINASSDYFCGPEDHTVSFTNTSSGADAGDATYEWFLDGTSFDNTTGLDAPSSVTLSSAGSYEITLVATHFDETCTESVETAIVVSPAPFTQFSYPAGIDCAGLPVSFTNLGSGITDHSTITWDFGDGTTSSEVSPTHAFPAGGTYTVTLTIENPPNCTSTYTQEITTLDIPDVSISGDDGSGNTINCLLPGDPTTSQTVDFFNATTDGVSYFWDFGEGTTSTEFEPSHLYDEYGTFDVSMTATGANGCTATANLEVVFERFVSSSLTLDITEYSGCIPHSLSTLVNTSVNATNFVWDFGDGSPTYETSDMTAPDHIYEEPGTYTLSLTSANSCNSANATISPIVIVGPPELDFTPSLTTVGCAPETISITNNSSGASPSNNYHWDMGNGNTYSNTYTVPNQEYENAGEYTITLTASNACGTSELTEELIIDSIPVATLEHDFFQGCSPLTVPVNNISEGNIDNYQWFLDGSPYSTAPTIDPIEFTATPGNTPENHEISLITSNDCGQTSTLIDVVVNRPTLADFDINRVELCEGETVSVVSTSLGENLSIEWDFGNGDTSTDEGPLEVTYTNPGTYTITLTADGLCGTDEKSVEIEVYSFPIASFTPSPTEGCSPLGVTFENNSTADASYLWDFGDNASIASSTDFNPGEVVFDSDGAEVISLTVTLNGCESNDSETITAFPLPDAIFEVSASEGCTPFSVDITNQSTDNGIEEFEWDFGNGTSYSGYTPPSQIYETLDDVETFTLSLTVKSGDDCERTYSETITVNQIPTAIFSIPATLCANEPLQIENNSTNATAYTWDFDDGNSSSEEAPAHLFDTPGEYTVHLTASNASSCSDETDHTITILIPPTPDFTNTTVCLGEITEFVDASGATITDWLWDFGDGNTSTEQNPEHLFETDGEFETTLRVENDLECFEEITRFVTVKPLPSPDFSAETFCLGETTDFTNTTTDPLTNQTWDFGDGTTSNDFSPDHTYISTGTYDVTLTTEKTNECSNSITKEVIITETPVADFSFIQACKNDTTHFTALAQGNPNSFLWDFGDGATSDEEFPYHIYETSGTYDVTLTTAIAETGCNSSITFEVEAYPRTSPAFNFNTACFGNETIFEDETQNNPIDWHWNFGDGNTSTAPSPNYEFDAPDIYEVVLTTENSYGCKDSITQLVEILPLPVPGFEANTVCLNASTTFTDESLNAVNWTYDFGDGTDPVTESNPTNNYTSFGDFSVKQIVTNDIGCKDSVSITVTVHPNPTANFETDAVCFSYTTSFNDLSVDALVWTWDFDDADITSELSNPTHSFSSEGTYDVKLVVENEYGCLDSLTAETIVYPKPIAQFSNQTVCAEQAMTFENTSIGATTEYLWDFGDGSNSTDEHPNHTYAIGGFYEVEFIVSNDVGCADTLEQEIEVFTVPTAGFEADTACLNTPTSFTNLSFDTTPISTWQWDFGDGNNSLSENPNYTYQNPGTYEVALTATNSNGCSNSFTQNVLVDEIPAVDFEATVACFGASTIFTDVSPSDATAWNWDFGDGTIIQGASIEEHTYSEPGNYLATLQITSGDGACTNQLSKMVNVVDAITATIQLNDEACTSETIAFNQESSISFGTISSYTWDMGDGTSYTSENGTHTYTNAGNYTVSLTVLSVNECSHTITHDIEIFPSPTANFQATEVCNSYTTEFTDLSEDVLNWHWDFNDNGNTSTASNPNHNFSNDGVYNVTLTVENEYGCTDALLQAITVLPKPTAQFEYGLICADSAIDFEQTSLGAPTHFTWNFGDGSQLNTNANPTHTFTEVGNYDVELIVENNSGCADTLSKEVEVYSVPNVSFVADTACLTNTTTFSNTTTDEVAISNWNWEFGDGNTSTAEQPMYTYTNSGVFNVVFTATNSNGCSNTSTQEVRVHAIPDAVFEADAPCFGMPTTFTDLSTGNPTSWTWTFGDGNVVEGNSTEQHTYSAPGNYLVTLHVAGGEGGCSNQTSQIVSVIDDITANMDIEQEACDGDSISFKDFSEVNFGEINTYEWNMGDGTIYTTESGTHLYDSPGTYTVTLRTTTVEGCFDTISKEVEIHPNPVAVFEAKRACQNQFTDFEDASMGEVSTWLWEFGDGNTASDTHPSHIYTSTGNYDVSLTVTSIHNCRHTTTQSITVLDAPVAQFSTEPVCYGEVSTFLDASEIVNDNIVSWEWNFNDEHTSFNQHPLHTFEAYQDSFDVRLIVTANNGCSDTLLQEVAIHPVVTFDFKASEEKGCAPVSLTFTDSSYTLNGASDIVNHHWEFGDGINSFNRNPNYIYADEGTYEVTLTVTTANGCTFTDTLHHKINIYPMPTAGFLATPTVTSVNDAHIQISDISSGATAYKYYFDNNYFSNEAEPSVVYDEPGKYLIMQIVQSKDNCIDTAFQAVRINPELSFYVPNSFTPNGDGRNDTFKWSILDVETFEIVIFNRWGQELYKTTDPDGSWDGTFAGQTVKDGVYIWKATITDLNGEIIHRKGHVTVFR